jgi:hypothetical protein
LDGMAASGKQQRVNTPLFGWDLVSQSVAFCFFETFPVILTRSSSAL